MHEKDWEMTTSKSRLLIIGLDALDWNLVQRKISANKLPNIGTIIQAGIGGPLRSLPPLFSPKLWATIATGKHSYEHGITGFVHLDHQGSGLSQYQSDSRRSPAFWNMLSHAGKRTHLIGWWNTYPAQSLNGVMVSDLFKVASHPFAQEWPVDPQSLYPSEESAKLAPLRVHPQQIHEGLLRRLLPHLYEMNFVEDRRVSDLATLLTEDITHLQIAEELIGRNDWDVTSIYLIGLDKISHLGLSFMDPPLPGINPWDHYCYGEIIDRGYELYDSWVGKLLEAAGEETTVMLLSDHGFYHDHRKPAIIRTSMTAPCAQHGPVGTLAFCGPGVRQGSQIKNASLLDICPTLLAQQGLPIGKDMEGRVLQEVWEKPCAYSQIPSWDQLLPRPQHKKLLPPDAQTTKAALHQLVALGYLPDIALSSLEQDLSDEEKLFITQAGMDHLLEEAEAYLQEGKIAEALPLLFELRQTDPQRNDLLATLANTFLFLEKPRRAAACLHRIVRNRTRDARKATELLKNHPFKKKKKLSTQEERQLFFLQGHSYFHHDGMAFTRLWAQWIADKTLERANGLAKLAKQYPTDLFMLIEAGNALLQSCDTSDDQTELGLCLLYHAARWEHQESEALNLIAQYYYDQKEYDWAQEIIAEALQRNPRDHYSHLLHAMLLLEQQELDAAKKELRQLRHHQLYRCRMYELFAQISQQEKRPKRSIARYRRAAKRATLFLKKLGEIQFLSAQRTDANSRQDPLTSKNNNSKNQYTPKSLKKRREHSDASEKITIVTGIPRSGTSLMMQLLHAAQIPIVTDQKRSADHHNPQGYWEHQLLKYPDQYEGILAEASGKALKIVIPLLWQLPLLGSPQYRILWMQRPLKEVIASQHAMTSEIASSQALMKTYRYYLAETERLLNEKGWSYLAVEYHQLLRNPRKQLNMIASFLEYDLSDEMLISLIDPQLYRHQRS